MTGPERRRTPLRRPTWTKVRGELVLVDPTPDELREEIRRQFHRSGMAYSALGNRAVTAGVWRAVARAVGRSLDRPVYTRQDGAEVRAWLKDWPRDARESEVHQRQVARRAAIRPDPDDQRPPS